jgi:Predicted pPIWI-associating nuclease
MRRKKSVLSKVSSRACADESDGGGQSAGKVAAMSFELPIKGDLDRVLSRLMHDARHKLMIEMNRIMAEAAAGGLHSNRTIFVAANLANQIHDASLRRAAPVLHQFIERLTLPPAQITQWARRHLENLGNSLLGLIKPNGFPKDHQRTVSQYRLIFNQRLDGMLREIDIGFTEKSGFAGITKVESKDWIRAATAVRLLEPTMISAVAAQIAICERAYAGIVRARATYFLKDNERFDNYEIPKEFWWAGGHAALGQNWATGDFDTWINHNFHWKAFGVLFLRADLELMVPPDSAPPEASPRTTHSDAEQKILNDLTNRLPSAALSYRQALSDLSDSERVSFRGAAHELREAVREVLDQLAPDEKVINAPGFKFEKDRTKPTMKQKVRFIFKNQQRSSTACGPAEIAADGIAEITASMARSTYDRGSISAHTEQTKAEVLKVKRYVDAVLHDILEV